MTRLAIVGAGMMGEAILAGLLQSGWEAGDIVVTDRRPERQREIQERHGVLVAADLDDVHGAATVLIAVKPQDVEALLAGVGGSIDSSSLVISICAGVTISTLEAGLPDGAPVVRVMPNTPARVGEGMSVISGGTHATPENLATATAVMGAVGRAVTLPERYQDAATAVSGSGPAYLFLVAEAMIEAGVLLGLPRAEARELTVQTLYGAAAMLRSGDEEHPTILRENVTSPGGTTAAALRRLEAGGLRSAFADALVAARDRSRELGA